MSGRANNRSQCASRWKRAVSSRCSGSLFLNTRGMAQIATALIGRTDERRPTRTT
jgi:hypothetical protein